MDIATYDLEESHASSSLQAWRLRSMFGPGLFEQVGFLTRFKHIGELRGMMSGMHHTNRLGSFGAEFNGLQKSEIRELIWAIAKYVKWFRAVLPDDTVPIPIGDFIAQYLAYTKLRGIAARGRVLEVGAGYGLSALFAVNDPEIECYTLMEITPSLYIIQAAICAYLYGEHFQNHAMTRAEPSAVGQLGSSEWRDKFHPSFVLPLDRRHRCRLYPWWRLDDVLNQEYDVIASHSNLAEMNSNALDYYLKQWSTCLADDGYLLVQDLGNPENNKHDTVLKQLENAGYRALVKAVGKLPDNKFLHFWNLLLVHERHPDYGVARPLSERVTFLSDHPTVRRAYRLDEEPGQSFTAGGLMLALEQILSQQR